MRERAVGRAELPAVGSQHSQQLAAASPHRRATRGGELLEQRNDPRRQLLVFVGKVGQRLHCAGLHDATSVVEVAEEHLDNPASVGGSQRRPAKQLRGVPAHFRVPGCGGDGQQRLRVRIEQLRPLATDLLDGIRSAHPHHRLFVVERGEDRGEQSGIGKHVINHLVRPTDGASVRRVHELADDGLDDRAARGRRPVGTEVGHWARVVTRNAAGRLAGEGVLVPTAFANAVWTQGSDPDTAVATWRIDRVVETVELRVGPNGQLVDVQLQRWGNPDRAPYGRYPFGVRVEAETRFGGLTIPSVLRAGWRHGTARATDGEFFRATIVNATFR